MRCRKAKYAGTFYPSDADALSAQIAEKLLSSKADHIAAKVLIVPGDESLHSSSLVASAYRCLQYNCQVIKQVILITHNPHVPANHYIVSNYQAFESPLGKTRINVESSHQLSLLPNVLLADEFHCDSLSTELNLPFLQLCLVDFDLVPIVIGNVTGYELSEMISPFIHRSDTLVVLSLSMTDAVSAMLFDEGDDHKAQSDLPMIAKNLLSLITKHRLSSRVYTDMNQSSSSGFAAVLSLS